MTQTMTPANSPVPAAYLRPAQACQHLNISRRCLSDWMRSGRIPYHKPARKVTLFSVADLNRAMADFRIDAV